MNISVTLASNTLPDDWVGLPFVPIYRANRLLTVSLLLHALPARLYSPPLPTLTIPHTSPLADTEMTRLVNYEYIRKLKTDTNIL